MGNDEQKSSAAEKNRQRSTEKVIEALGKLKKGNKPITIQLVAKTAGVARRTLQYREDLKSLIKEAQSLMEDKLEPEKKKKLGLKPKGESIREQRLSKQREKNKELIQNKIELLEQNMILTKKVTELERKISDLEERLFERNSLKVITKMVN